MEGDDYFDEFFEPISRKKKRKVNKWDEKFKIRGDRDEVYTVSHATPGEEHGTGEWGCSCPAWIFKRARCKHIETISDFRKLRDKVPKELRVANIDFYVGGSKAFCFWGARALRRAEMLTGVNRDEWIFTRWMATDIPTVYYDVGKDVQLHVTYQKYSNRDRYDE